MSGEMLSRLTVSYLDTTVSPNAYSDFENASGNIQIGFNNPLVDVTNFGDSARRYIAGISDGKEFAFECFRTHASNSVQNAMRTLAQAKTNVQLRVVLTDFTVSPNTTDTAIFTAVPIDLDNMYSVADAAKMMFGFKISGTIAFS